MLMTSAAERRLSEIIRTVQCPAEGSAISSINWHYTLEDPAKKLPLDIFEAQPCIGKRVAVLTVQIEPEDKVSFLITGNTWSFRQRLDAFGVALGYTGEDQARKYFRLLQSQDMTNEEHRKRVLDMLADGVFKNLAMLVE